MMEWLGFPGEAMQDDLINTGHPGSSQWLFEREEFIDWLTADGQSGLWLRGPRKIPSAPSSVSFFAVSQITES